jgi:hypothetical protein
MTHKWQRADDISDQIVDILKAEYGKPDFSPMQALAGMMLAMCSFASTCPKELAPEPYIAVMNAIQRCLNSMMEATDEAGLVQ